ncbi:MAG: efflux RND transporter periplasmic adaptor subunit [Polyangiaceae bacterium]|nr:efflux RND transporter periplasmic adaptor subunit [Polyangiaceae bacterium]
MNTATNTTASPRKFNGWAVFAILMAIAITGLVGARVKAKVAQNKELEASRQTTQAAAGADAKAPTVTATGVEIISPMPTKWQPRVDITGTLEPIQQADVGFKMGGRLLAIKVKSGDTVKTGQVLGTIDAAEAAAQARVAQTGVKVAEISLDMAKDGQKRTDTLFQQNAIAEAEKTTATQRALLAAAQLEQARAQAKAVSVTLSNATLTAPFAGLVTRVPPGIGRIVGPGEPLFHIEDTSVLKLSASLSESDARVVVVGSTVTIEGAANATGKVTAVLGSLDPQTRRVPLVAEIPNGTDSGLLAGSFVRAQVVAEQPVDALELPGSAIRPGSQDEVVVVKDGKAHLVRVSFANGASGTIYVRKGLDASDRVVARPRSETKEGDAIDLAPAAK